jgi:hypothetical protein
MKYEKGTKVIVKPFQLLANQHKTNKYGDIVRDGVDGALILSSYAEDCLRGTDRAVTVVKYSASCYEYLVQFPRDEKRWIGEEAIIGHAFSYGAEIEVRDTENGEWIRGIFVGYVPGSIWPVYVVTQNNDRAMFQEGKEFDKAGYRFARPIPKPESEPKQPEVKNIFQTSQPNCAEHSFTDLVRFWNGQSAFGTKICQKCGFQYEWQFDIPNSRTAVEPKPY